MQSARTDRATPYATTDAVPLARAVVAFIVAACLAAAPSVGLAWPDAPPKGAAERGAMAGVLPLVADPGHRMGAGAAGPASALSAGALAPGQRAFDVALRVLAAATPLAWPQQAWLDRMLVGARLQTDGG